MRQSNINEIIEVLASAWDCSVRACNPTSRRGNGLYKRFVLVQILCEEGFTDAEVQAQLPNLTRRNLLYSRRVFAELLGTNSEIKTLYLTAVKALENLDYDDQVISTAV